MVFKINISEKGKTYHFELDSEALIGKKLGEKIQGGELLPDLKNYELVITGASDKAGFPSLATQEGPTLRKVLLTYGKAMKKKPKKEGKKRVGRNKPKGLRLRKSVRGNTISGDIVQINVNVLKTGEKPLTEIFPDQVKPEKQAGKISATEQKEEKPVEQEKQKLTKQEQPEKTKEVEKIIKEGEGTKEEIKQQEKK